jgi:hypothetical protein
MSLIFCVISILVVLDVKREIVMDKRFIVLCGLALGADHATGADESSLLVRPVGVADIHQDNFIYFNMVTGERVVTLADQAQVAPADSGVRELVWSSAVNNTCADAGYSTEYVYTLYDNAPQCSSTLCSESLELVDFGDLPIDTVIDCVRVSWVVSYTDQDLDSDGFADGVEDLVMEWAVWDTENGRESQESMRLPLAVLTVFDLPGHLGPVGGQSMYHMDIDLVGDGYDLSFEIGDSDGDCQTAAFCNSDVDGMGTPVAFADRDGDGLMDADLDSDGLFDWGWSVRVFTPLPGRDLDGDGVTGVQPPIDADTVGLPLGAPAGHAEMVSPEEWAWVIDSQALGAGTGQEDRFAFYRPTGDLSTRGDFVQPAWFGGFACEGGVIADGGFGYSPPAMFEFELYTQGDPGLCAPDLNQDGVLNFFDISAFLSSYQSGGDYNGDGLTDFFDVSHFLSDYNAGCP